MKILPDLLTIAGLAMLGYGLWLYSEPLSYSVVGALLLTGGLMLGKSEKNKAE